MLFSSCDLHDDITHGNIAASGVKAAAAILRSHPNHPVTPSEVLGASQRTCADAVTALSAHILWLRFVAVEDEERDVILSQEVNERFGMEQHMRAFTTCVAQYVKSTHLHKGGESSVASIAALSAVLKTIVQHEALF